MSKFSDMIQNSQVKIVFPMAGDLVYAAAMKDIAVCFTINICYVESSNIDILIMFCEYLKRVSKVKEVGSLSMVNIASYLDNELHRVKIQVYRQRLVFSSLTDMIAIAKKFSINLEITDDFAVKESNLSRVSKTIPYLKQYYKFHENGYHRGTFYEWLTYCLIAQMVLLCRAYSLSISLPKNRPLEMHVGDMFRVPFICGTLNKNSGISSIVILRNDDYVIRDKTGEIIGSLIEYHDSKSDNLGIFESTVIQSKSKSKPVKLFGFSLGNVEMDIKRGLILRNES